MTDTFHVGLVQLPNDTNITANVARAMRALDALAHTDLMVFPEAFLTGFSARLEACDIEALRPHLEALGEAAMARGVEVVMPSALRLGEAWANAGWVMSGGRRDRFEKVGLTASERQFFREAPDPGARVFTCKGVRCGLVMCREVGDDPGAYWDASELDVILWPGYCRWEDAEVWGERGRSDMGADAYRAVQAWGRPLLQSNFCSNQAADPRRQGPNGRSCVVSSRNVLLHQGETEVASAVVVTLERRGRWEVSECVDVRLENGGAR